VRDIGAQHVERAVREVDDARDAEDERQPRRDEEQRRRAGKTVDELDEEGGESHVTNGSRRTITRERLPSSRSGKVRTQRKSTHSYIRKSRRSGRFSSIRLPSGAMR